MKNPGKLDRRITIQVRGFSQDDMGGRVETWTNSIEAWAEVMRQTEGEKLIADGDRIQEMRDFRIRWRQGINAGTHRVYYQGRYYNVMGVTEEGRQDALILNCMAIDTLTNL